MEQHDKHLSQTNSTLTQAAAFTEWRPLFARWTNQPMPYPTGGGEECGDDCGWSFIVAVVAVVAFVDVGHGWSEHQGSSGWR